MVDTATAARLDRPVNHFVGVPPLSFRPSSLHAHTIRHEDSEPCFGVLLHELLMFPELTCHRPCLSVHLIYPSSYGCFRLMDAISARVSSTLYAYLLHKHAPCLIYGLIRLADVVSTHVSSTLYIFLLIAAVRSTLAVRCFMDRMPISAFVASTSTSLKRVRNVCSSC